MKIVKQIIDYDLKQYDNLSDKDKRKMVKELLTLKYRKVVPLIDIELMVEELGL